MGVDPRREGRCDGVTRALRFARERDEPRVPPRGCAKAGMPERATDEGRSANARRTREQAEAVDDMENAIDDARLSRGVIGSSSSYANPAYAPTRGAVDESFESVPLKGAGRSLAQRASAHLKALKKSIKKAFTDSGNSSSPASTARRTTYANDTFVGSPPTGQMLASHHARSRSVDLQHILGNLEETLEGADTAATLLHELRDSGGDPDVDAATNDALEQELSDVCEAHRSHLTQVAEMSGAGVALSEEQLGTLLSTVEKLNAALLAMKSETGGHIDAVSAPSAAPDGRPSLGSSRIECATTEEEEAAMIAQAIAASLSVQPSTSEESGTENALPAPVAAAPPALPPTSQQSASATSRPKTNEELLGNLIDL